MVGVRFRLTVLLDVLINLVGEFQISVHIVGVRVVARADREFLLRLPFGDPLRTRRAVVAALYLLDHRQRLVL